MGDFDFTDNIVSLKRYPSQDDASLVLAALRFEGIDALLDHTESDFELLVRQGDYRRAKEILAQFEQDEHQPAEPIDDYDATDWSGEDWADDEDDIEEEYSEEPQQTPPAIRAWRAAVIGTIFLPMNLYSWWLIIKYELWLANPANANPRWRFFTTIVFNFVGIAFFWAWSRSWW